MFPVWQASPLQGLAGRDMESSSLSKRFLCPCCRCMQSRSEWLASKLENRCEPFNIVTGDLGHTSSRAISESLQVR